MGILTEQQISTGDKCAVVGAHQLQLVHPAVVPPSQLQMTNEESECLRELRKLIKEDEFIRDSGIEQDDEFLLAFVRGRKCNVQKVFKCYHNYVHMRKVKYYKFFKGLTPHKLKYLLDANSTNRFAAKLRYTDPEGRMVGLAKASNFNPRIHKGEDAIQGFVLSGQEILRLHDATRHGIVLVVDAAGFGFRHAREITMSRIYMFLQIFLSAYPVKYKGFHIMNNPYLFDTILALIKQLLPKKLRDRIYLHGSNYESLHKYVPREILPASFGGILTDEEAIDFEFEERYLAKMDYYEKWAANL